MDMPELDRVRETAAVRTTKVLIVDDQPEIVGFVDRVLGGAGYGTRVAYTGPEALAIAETEGPFDLLLTDVCMPEMSGSDLARRIRLRQPDVRVLYLTGYNEQLFSEKGTLWEGEAFLDKPTTIDGLLQAVSLLLYGSLHGQTSAPERKA